MAPAGPDGAARTAPISSPKGKDSRDRKLVNDLVKRVVKSLACYDSKGSLSRLDDENMTELADFVWLARALPSTSSGIRRLGLVPPILELKKRFCSLI
jgi:hypothetical protein